MKDFLDGVMIAAPCVLTILLAVVSCNSAFAHAINEKLEAANSRRFTIYPVAPVSRCDCCAKTSARIKGAHFRFESSCSLCGHYTGPVGSGRKGLWIFNAYSFSKPIGPRLPSMHRIEPVSSDMVVLAKSQERERERDRAKGRILQLLGNAQVERFRGYNVDANRLYGQCLRAFNSQLGEAELEKFVLLDYLDFLKESGKTDDLSRIKLQLSKLQARENN